MGLCFCGQYLEQLERIKGLHESGVLSAEEYEEQKGLHWATSGNSTSKHGYTYTPQRQAMLYVYLYYVSKVSIQLQQLFCVTVVNAESINSSISNSESTGIIEP